MSDPVLHILLALSDEPRHGYAIVQEIDERTGGAVLLGTGTLYSALKRLRNDGLIQEVKASKHSEGGRAKRTYGLTKRGKQALKEQTERLQALVDHAMQKKTLAPSPRAAR